jgi:hypothetical protein
MEYERGIQITNASPTPTASTGTNPGSNARLSWGVPVNRMMPPLTAVLAIAANTMARDALESGYIVQEGDNLIFSRFGRYFPPPAE